MLRKVIYVAVRVLAATIFAIIVMFLPSPDEFPPWVAKIQQPVIVFLLVCYIGKLLYDTLFYDHYGG
jgi:hypothetical protein